MLQLNGEEVKDFVEKFPEEIFALSDKSVRLESFFAGEAGEVLEIVIIIRNINVPRGTIISYSEISFPLNRPLTLKGHNG